VIKYVFAYLGAGITFAVIDAVWLTTMTDRFYKPVLGPILADKPDMRAAVLFYLISIAGTVFLAIAPALKDGSWTRAAINGAADRLRSRSSRSRISARTVSYIASRPFSCNSFGYL